MCSSDLSYRNRAARMLWAIVWGLCFRPSPRPFHGWRRSLLRLFGATIEAGAHPYPSAKIWAPWNLVCEDTVAIAEDVVIYNPAPVTLKSHAIVSQQAYLCGATHDQDDPAFPLIAKPIVIERYAWICARAVAQPGITVREGAVLGLASVATRDLDPWTVYVGAPARAVKKRKSF